jgi:hypothetical protein
MSSCVLIAVTFATIFFFENNYFFITWIEIQSLNKNQNIIQKVSSFFFWITSNDNMLFNTISFFIKEIDFISKFGKIFTCLKTIFLIFASIKISLRFLSKGLWVLAFCLLLVFDVKLKLYFGSSLITCWLSGESGL